MCKLCVGRVEGIKQFINIEITVKVNGKEIALSDISTETFEKIKKADAPLKLGDIIESTGGFGKRVVLFDEHRQCLVAFSANGCAVAWADINMYYKKTVRNSIETYDFCNDFTEISTKWKNNGDNTA